ncbi:hypothetical protein M8C21_028773 [Ambrosia artemisiifolia]|uniref:Uncharacterized protein n=1 Tax=Ambrosia artemisiifolia TaxID=4212 RepID=A0AAD5C1Z8_AMBAR|nr:hypothetical protein M8C21_028773 [Ambrosia artemisiifolia]
MEAMQRISLGGLLLDCADEDQCMDQFASYNNHNGGGQRYVEEMWNRKKQSDKVLTSLMFFDTSTVTLPASSITLYDFSTQSMRQMTKNVNLRWTLKMLLSTDKIQTGVYAP